MKRSQSGLYDMPEVAQQRGTPGNLCYWHGAPIECGHRCYFYQPEGLCFLSTLPGEWPDSFRERFQGMSQDEANVFGFEMALQLEVLGGFSPERVHMVLSMIGAVNARA